MEGERQEEHQKTTLSSRVNRNVTEQPSEVPAGHRGVAAGGPRAGGLILRRVDKA